MSPARALVWEGGADFRMTEIPLPALEDSELLVRMRTATICGSDRHTVSGRRSGACPSVLGHEGVGEVVESRRAGVRAGDRVVFSVTSTCGHCDNCRRGLSAKCESVLKVGHEPLGGEWPLSGTYASHLHVLAGQKVSVVPPQVPDAAASTAGCAVATVMAALEKAGDLQGRSVMVAGLGMLGVVAVAAARARGAEYIVATDPDVANRALVADLADLATEPGGHHEVDVSLEFSGSAAGVEDCLRALRTGGTAVLAGTVAPVPSVGLDPEWLVRGWHTVTGVHNYEPHHLDEAVAFLAEEGERLPWEPILGDAVTLEGVPRAFSEETEALRVVVDLTHC